MLEGEVEGLFKGASLGLDNGDVDGFALGENEGELEGE